MEESGPSGAGGGSECRPKPPLRFYWLQESERENKVRRRTEGSEDRTGEFKEIFACLRSRERKRRGEGKERATRRASETGPSRLVPDLPA